MVVESEEEQLVYSWHKVNVFTTLTSVRGSGWFKRKTRESREKHILKDGKDGGTEGKMILLWI